MSAPERCFMLPTSERSHAEPSDVWHEIEPDLSGDEPADRAWTVDECTVVPNLRHLPDESALLDLIFYATEDAEVSEWWPDDLERVMHESEVTAAATDLLALIASKMTAWMTGDKVAEHLLTVGADGEPLWDGKPIFAGVDRG